MRKWKIAALCAVLACLAIAATGTLAFFTASETAHNVITSGGVAIDLIEQSRDETGRLTPWQDVDGVMPGAEVSKIVTVQNTGASDAWVRLRVETSIELSRPQPGDAKGAPAPSLLVLNINTADWTEKDGYYYYNQPLKPGQTTTPLFETVTFDAAMGNEYQGSAFSVDVFAQAVQVANNGTSALTAAGWPVSP